MDEDACRPRYSCSPGVDASGLCVCLAGPLRGSRPALQPALVAYAVVVLGSGHTVHSLDGPADPRFEQATYPTSSGASGAEPAGDERLCLCFRNGSRHVRDWRLEGLAEYRVSDQYAARHVPVELADLLA